MEILRLIEKVRVPFFDKVFSAITYFGDEILILAIAFAILWCINKRLGYYIIYSTVPGTLINLLLKSIFCVPRPWIKDPSFTIVESAREKATGYSFPSGHTQNSTVFYGALAKSSDKRLLRALLISLILLIGFSRMYLGVHTPADVVTSWIIGTVLVFVMYSVVNRAIDNPKFGMIMNLTLLSLSIGLVLFCEYFPLPLNAVEVFAEEGRKNAYTLLGVTAAMPLVLWADHYKLKYDIKAKWWAQILKCSFGLALIVALRVLLKQPLMLLTGGHLIADSVRYFFIVLFGGIFWPMTFRFWGRL